MTDIITIIIICMIIICFFYGLLNIGMCDYVFKIHYIRNFLNRIGMQRRTKYRVRKALKELRELELLEYTSQGCPAIVSYRAESYPELIDDARPPINGYALTKKAFESELWKECYSEWSKGMEEWASLLNDKEDDHE